MQDYQPSFIEYLKAGITPFHLVQHCVKDLQKAGFVPLRMEEPWELQAQGRYYIDHHGSTVLAFVVPEPQQMLPAPGHIALRVAAAHTDYPCLRIKSHPDIASEGYQKLNAEIYGGAILNTWLDRPLGIAGRVALRSSDWMHPTMRYYDSGRGVATIPNLAIHMNRDVNKGVELNKQIDMLPLFGLGDEDDAFLSFLAQELSVAPSDILDYELSVYVAEEPQLVGVKQEMLSAARIDNLSSCAAIMEAICRMKQTDHLNIGVCFDHEEIGSKSKQGAGSAFLSDVIEKIYESMGLERRCAKDAIYQGLMLSVDVAHALHPNHGEKMDLTNHPVLGKGFVIKEAAAQSYATDCEAIGMVEQLAGKYDIPYQKFVNRSDVVGGGTLGAIASAGLPMRTVDIGVPMLAMHSARELMGTEDYSSRERIIAALYQEQ